MEPGEALSATAQIAVALAGFAGVVVAFRSSSLHDWPALDRVRLLNLLGNSLIALFACLFGMLLLTIRPVPLSIWRWCSAFVLLVAFASTFLGRRRLSEFRPTVIEQTGPRYAFYMIRLLAMAAGLLQIYNAVFSGVFWIFYTIVVYALAFAALQLARMILQPPAISG